MAISWVQICTAIKDTLAASTDVKEVLLYDRMTDAISARACPIVFVYPNFYTPDARNTTERTSFNASVQYQELTVFVDVYASERTKLAEDMTQMVTACESLSEILQVQEKRPFFGLEGIKNFAWDWRRVTFRFGTHQYMGGRFTLGIRVF